MDSLNPHEIAPEPELAPLVCPRCAYEIEQEPWPKDCPRCGERIDLTAQFAYCRGVDAFTVGQDLLIKISPKKRRRNPNAKDELEGLQYYRQAYSSLQVAFHGELAESQRQLGIRMMAAIANIFQIHFLISAVEAGYWSILLKELNVQLELATLKERLENGTQTGLAGLAQRWQGRRRMKQLEKGLVKLDAKIRFFEQNIEFVERPRLHRRSGSGVLKR